VTRPNVGLPQCLVPAPQLFGAILDGTQSAKLTGKMLKSADLPCEWDKQLQLLGSPTEPDLQREPFGGVRTSAANGAELRHS
jgi:hypothetical protein